MTIQTENKPLRKKPKVSKRINYNRREDYIQFCEKYPNEKITYRQFKDVIEVSNEIISENILNNPLGFKLPYQLGYIAVDKTEPSKRVTAIDWVATRRLGKKIPILNFHSLGFIFKIKIFKNPKKVPFSVYKMEANRFLKRKLATKIKSKKYNFIKIDRSYYSSRFRINQHLKNIERFGKDNG